MEPNNPQPQSPYPEPQLTPSPSIDPYKGINPGGPPTAPLQQSNTPLTSTAGMFSGRLNRIGFLMSIVYIFAFFLIPIIIVLLLRGQAIGNIIAILFGIVGMVLIIPVTISVGVRRWHDMDQSGLMMLLSIVPFVGFILLIIYLFVPGTKTANKYGEPDTRPSSMVKVLFGK